MLNYRKPIILIIIIIIVAATIFGIWSATNPKEDSVSLPLGTYTLEDSSSIIPPSITLGNNNEFSFTYSLLSSYANYGTYSIEDGRLILTTSDQLYTYVFLIDRESLAFQAARSSETMVFGDEIPLFDADVFTYVGKNADAFIPQPLI